MINSNVFKLILPLVFCHVLNLKSQHVLFENNVIRLTVTKSTVDQMICNNNLEQKDEVANIWEVKYTITNKTEDRVNVNWWAVRGADLGGCGPTQHMAPGYQRGYPKTQLEPFETFEMNIYEALIQKTPQEYWGITDYAQIPRINKPEKNAGIPPVDLNLNKIKEPQNLNPQTNEPKLQVVSTPWSEWRALERGVLEYRVRSITRETGSTLFIQFANRRNCVSEFDFELQGYEVVSTPIEGFTKKHLSLNHLEISSEYQWPQTFNLGNAGNKKMLVSNFVPQNCDEATAKNLSLVDPRYVLAMTRYKESITSGNDEQALKYAREAESYVNDTNREDFKRNTSDFIFYMEKKSAQNTIVNLEERSRQERERIEREQAEKERIDREKQQALQQKIDDANAEQQQRQEASVAATTAQIASMGTFGAFMFKNIGPEYDKPKNKFVGGSTRFSFNLGYSASILPIYENTVRDFTSINGTNKFKETTEETIYTLNLDLGLQFWPYYGKHFGLGILGNGQGGMMPISGTSLTYSYDYGVKAFLGSWPIKFLIMYQMGDRGFSYSHKFSSGAANTVSEAISVGEGATKFSRVSFGPRISFDANTSIGNLELTYFTETYQNLKQISANGFVINYYSHNRLRIYGEIILGGARLGLIDYDLENGVKNTGSHYKFGIVRTMDWFGQKK